MKTVLAIAAAILVVGVTAANAQPRFRSPANDGWYLQSSAHEPCWSIANPVACNPHVKPGAWVNFRRDGGAPQSYWTR